MFLLYRIQQNDLAQKDKISYDEQSSVQVDSQKPSLEVKELEFSEVLVSVPPLSQDVTSAKSPESAPQSPTSSDTHEWYNSQGVRFTPQEEGILLFINTTKAVQLIVDKVLVLKMKSCVLLL